MNTDFPAGTFLINVSGSFLLGLIVGLTAHHGLSSSTAVVLGAGFTGGGTKPSARGGGAVWLGGRRGGGLAGTHVVGSPAPGGGARGAGGGGARPAAAE